MTDNMLVGKSEDTCMRVLRAHDQNATPALNRIPASGDVPDKMLCHLATWVKTVTALKATCLLKKNLFPVFEKTKKEEEITKERMVVSSYCTSFIFVTRYSAEIIDQELQIYITGKYYCTKYYPEIMNDVSDNGILSNRFNLLWWSSLSWTRPTRTSAWFQWSEQSKDHCWF